MGCIYTWAGWGSNRTPPFPWEDKDMNTKCKCGADTIGGKSTCGDVACGSTTGQDEPRCYACLTAPCECWVFVQELDCKLPGDFDE